MKMRKYIDLIQQVSEGKHFSTGSFSKGDSVMTPVGKGTVMSVQSEKETDKERSLTGHLGANDKRVMKRAKVKLKDGRELTFPVFQLQK